MTGWQAGRLAGWQAGGLAGWQAGGLAGSHTHDPSHTTRDWKSGSEPSPNQGFGLFGCSHVRAMLSEGVFGLVEIKDNTTVLSSNLLEREREKERKRKQTTRAIKPS